MQEEEESRSHPDQKMVTEPQVEPNSSQQEQQLQLNQMQVSSSSTDSSSKVSSCPILAPIAKTSHSSVNKGSESMDASKNQSSSTHENTDVTSSTISPTKKKNEGGSKRANPKKTKSVKNSGSSSHSPYPIHLPTMSTSITSATQGSMVSFVPPMYNVESSPHNQAQNVGSNEHILHHQKSVHNPNRRNIAATSVTDSMGRTTPFQSSLDTHHTAASGGRGSGGNSNISAIKILVTNNVAGSIIGKSGKTISEMQQQSQCRIKLSQARDYFPGTNDRVCLLVADNTEFVKRGAKLVLDKYQAVQSTNAQKKNVECNNR